MTPYGDNDVIQFNVVSFESKCYCSFKQLRLSTATAVDRFLCQITEERDWNKENERKKNFKIAEKTEIFSL